MKLYGCRVKDQSILMDSRSGGAFTALSDVILKRSGIIYGCRLNEKLQAVHCRADNSAGRESMRGSKYVQSVTGDTFEQVKKDLDAGRYVLYSGTSCQIAGLLSYIRESGTDDEKLYTVDIICHGVPSPMVFNDYITWLKENYNIKKIESYEFRNKKAYGWTDCMETVHTPKKDHDISIFSRLFYKNLTLRPVCYSCRYKSYEHEADITLGDFWGYEKNENGNKYNDDKGISLVFTNTSKGQELFDSAANSVAYFECSKEECIQAALFEPSKKPSNREEFWKDYKNENFDYIARKYAGYTFKTYLKGKLPGKISRKIYKLLKKR